MDIKYIKKALRPLKSKIHLEKSTKLLLYILATAGLIAFILAIISLFIVVPFVRMKMLLILATAFFGAVLTASFLSPTQKQVIITADSLGLKERVITAWYLKDDNSPVSLLQRKDTNTALKKINLKTAYKIKIPKKLFIIAVIIISVAFLVSFIPGKMGRQTQLREALLTEMNKQENMLEKELEKQIEKHPGMSEEQLKELKKALEKLKEEFNKAKSEEDALKALSQMKNLFEKLNEQSPLRDLKALESAFASSSLTEEISKALENEDEEALKKALEQLKKEIENQKNREEVAELLKKSSQSMGSNSMMANAIEGIVSSIAGGSSKSEDISQSLKELIKQALENAAGKQAFMQAVGELGEAANKAKLNVASVDRYIAQVNNGNGGTLQGGQSQDSQPGDQGQGSQPGGQGQGSQPGDPSQEGGAGAGSGSTDKDAGYIDADQPGGGRAPGDRKENEYRSIYVPERLGGGSNESVISGQKLQSGSSTFEEADGAPVQKGVMLPWNEVLSEYREEAVRSMDRQEIPAGMEMLVRDYFSSLE